MITTQHRTLFSLPNQLPCQRCAHLHPCATLCGLRCCACVLIGARVNACLPCRRATFDKTGITDEDLAGDESGALFAYFSKAFRKVTEEDIDAFYVSSRTHTHTHTHTHMQHTRTHGRTHIARLRTHRKAPIGTHARTAHADQVTC